MDADSQSGLQLVVSQLHDSVGDAYSADGHVPLADTQAFIQHGVGAQDRRQVQ